MALSKIQKIEFTISKVLIVFSTFNWIFRSLFRFNFLDLFS